MGRFAEAVSTEDQTESTPKSQDNQRHRSKLTEAEMKLLDEKRTDIHQLAAERRRLKDEAERELNSMVTVDKNSTNLITTKEYKDFRTQLDNTESPEQTQKILDKIKELARQKEQEKGNLAAETKRRDPEDPSLLNLQEQFDKICDENKHLIGTKQVPGFKEWFAQERRKNPTLKHLKEQIKKLEGKEITDRNGLAPRREEYQALQRLFKRYGLGEPADSKWVKEEGLSERKRFRQNAETMEKHLDHQRDTGFYSKEMIDKTMRTVLNVNNPQEQEQFLNKARTTARRESESYVYLDNRIDVKGKSIRKMSEKSKKKLIDYYKNETDFDERAKTDFKQLVENEGNLAKQLEEIYKDDTKGLHLALDKFQHLDFNEKQEALKEHEVLVKQQTEKDERHKKLILDGATTAIDKAESENTISEKTAERYQKLFEDENNYKNPETNKPGDLKTLEKMYAILISASPQENYKNLAAYKARRDKFVKDLQALQGLNQKLEEKDIADWQEQYDKESWSKRAIIHEKLKKEVLKKRLEVRKNKKQEIEAGLTKQDKKETKEFTKTKSEVIEAATIHMSEDSPREALKLLILYDEQNPNDKQILFLIEMAAKQLRELGNKKEVDKDFEKDLEDEVKDIANTGQNQKDVEEEQVTHLNIVGARQSEQRHEKQKDAQVRAEDESLERLPSDTIEEDLTEDYYEQAEDGYILNEDATGEEIEEIEFDNIAWNDQERHRAKVKLYEKQDRIAHKEGLLSQFKDKDGRVITSEEAEEKQEKDIEDVTKTIAKEAYDRAEKKQTAKAPAGNIIEMQRRIAAKRKAREYIDKKINERIKDAA